MIGGINEIVKQRFFLEVIQNHHMLTRCGKGYQVLLFRFQINSKKKKYQTLNSLLYRSFWKL